MYSITLLDDNIPSPYELLFNRKPRSFIPGCQRTAKSSHPENDQHIEQHQRRQEDQTTVYNTKLFMKENHSNLVNQSTYTSRSTKNGNQGQSWDKINKKLNQEHTQFTRATKNIGGRENIWRYENIQLELPQTHRQVAQPPTSHQQSTSRN